MKWDSLLSISAICINICSAADYKKLVQDKSKAIWNDIQAGKISQNPASPLLTKTGKEYVFNVVRAQYKEEVAFNKLESVLLNRQEDRKNWDREVDEWAQQFEATIQPRKLLSSQKAAFTDLISTTKKVLHVINYINGTTQAPTSGLNSRQSVGILFHDFVEAMRLAASPWVEKETPRAQKETMEHTRTRQVEVLSILRGIFGQIPEAYPLLDEAVIEIVGRNEKERGKDYFMNFYAPNNTDESSKNQIKHIVELYRRQQKRALKDRETEYVERMDALLVRLSTLGQDVSYTHHPAQIEPGPQSSTTVYPDGVHGVQETQDTYQPDASLASHFTKIGESLYGPWLTDFPVLPFALAAPSTKSITATNSSISAKSAVSSAKRWSNETFTTTVHAISSAKRWSNETFTTTVHPIVTVTEPVTTTIHPTVTITESVPSSIINSSIATTTSEWNVHWVSPQKRKEGKVDDDDKNKKIIAVAVSLGLGGAALPGGAFAWKTYRNWRLYKQRAEMDMERDMVMEELWKTRQSTMDGALDFVDSDYQRFLHKERVRLRSMKGAQRFGRRSALNRLGGEALSTIHEASQETLSYATTAEEVGSMAGDVAQMAINEVGRDLAHVGQLTEAAVGAIENEVPLLFGWLFDQAKGLGEAAFENVVNAVSECSTIGQVGVDRISTWSDEAVKGNALKSISDWLSDEFNPTRTMNLLLGPAFRLIQGLTQTERLHSFEEDVREWRHRRPTEGDAEGDKPSKTRAQETGKPSPTNAPQPTESGLKAPKKGDEHSNGSEFTRDGDESSPATTVANAGPMIPLGKPGNSTTSVPSGSLSVPSGAPPPVVVMPTSNATSTEIPMIGTEPVSNSTSSWAIYSTPASIADSTALVSNGTATEAGRFYNGTSLWAIYSTPASIADSTALVSNGTATEAGRFHNGTSSWAIYSSTPAPVAKFTLRVSNGTNTQTPLSATPKPRMNETQSRLLPSPSSTSNANSTSSKFPHAPTDLNNSTLETPRGTSTSPPSSPADTRQPVTATLSIGIATQEALESTSTTSFVPTFDITLTVVPVETLRVTVLPGLGKPIEPKIDGKGYWF
ncbi:hypothetical protein FKW77_005234 [Venturia effusa]|uniref:Uncharacterized protein n=1 Tax=Venturia effusa TaxID=50376 RepID=A0A517LNY6_9PEZI|nr:hypothetical protein FKW77_005234 [Venturia effusa]